MMMRSTSSGDGFGHIMSRAEGEAEVARFAEILRAAIDAPAPPDLDPILRDRVNTCPERGGELPVSAYANEGCCSGPTRWACSAGQGSKPGRPTLADCLRCVGGA